jgi:hypothetical protein
MDRIERRFCTRRWVVDQPVLSFAISASLGKFQNNAYFLKAMRVGAALLDGGEWVKRDKK